MAGSKVVVGGTHRRDSRKTSGDSVGIPAIHGGEDVKSIPSLNPNAKPTTSMLRKRLGSRLAETVALSFFNIAIRQLESSFRLPSFNNFLHKFLRRSLVIRVNEYFGRPQLFCLHTIRDFMLLQRPANGAHRADILAGPDQL